MATEKDDAAAQEEAWAKQKRQDDEAIQKLMGGFEMDADGPGFLDASQPIDQSGKADDAEDFEDISDDDLPDEEEGPSAGTSIELPGLTDDGATSNDADDLFGEGPSSPTDPILGPPSPAPHVHDDDNIGDTQQNDVSLNFPISFDPDPHANGALNQDYNIPAPAETAEDLVKTAFPDFKQGRTLVFHKLLPPKQAKWKEKKPTKRLKRLVTGKLTLELEQDSITAFRLPETTATTLRQDYLNELVRCGPDSQKETEDVSQFDIDKDSDSELVDGRTLRDFEMACSNWFTMIGEVEQQFEDFETAERLEAASRKRQIDDEDDEWNRDFLMDDVVEEQPVQPKKRKTYQPGLPKIAQYTAPSFDDFEAATRRGAKRVHYEMTDPHLLIETSESQRNAKRPRREDKDSKRMANGKLGRSIASRFNTSNDEAYDLLKENHQSKVRATLGNISVEHSQPALKLQWPYYKVKLDGPSDEYHRPRFRYKKFAGHTIRFEKPVQHKRKHMKGKVSEVFVKAKDMSFNDNSTAVLYEYCEPRPRVLNKFGMGSKLINYYRRKDAKDDESLPKQDLGEIRLLQPEDRSPFALFGTVDPGETVPTLHNEMYRAPVFKHAPRTTDFVMVRNTTGIEGSKWFLRKVDHMHVVGQVFPSVEVPGPHSRKVTNAAKNRMKMLCYRFIRHSPTANCSLSEITKHIADSTEAQNRQKLKEFLQYDKTKERGQWKLKPGEPLPPEPETRAMIKPEEVALLDGMQLGIKELEDAGFDPRNAHLDDDNHAADGDNDEEEDEDGSKIGGKAGGKKAVQQEETLADKLAPWKTTKAFIDASASKAMLQLHGEGDPTGHGLGFSFIRTSMKGGYIEAVQGPLATSADAMEREKRANGGHAYNVKKQQAMYEEGIREIWEKQKATLSDPQEHDDNDVANNEDEDDRFNVNTAATPARHDEGASQISAMTSASRSAKRAMRIVREIRQPDGTIERVDEIVHDPVVISQYMKRKTELDADSRDIYATAPTGNADADRLQQIRISKELERLEKNKARRQAREQQKELHNRASIGGNTSLVGDAGSPPAAGSGDKVIASGTTRKCANCGQVGHIKTNKKLCPMLNGTDNKDKKDVDHGGFGSYNAPAGAAGSP